MSRPSDHSARLLDFSVRTRAEELMDRPDCDTRHLLRTVDQFASINRMFSRYRTLLKRTVLRDMRRDPDREYHLVDLGAGGCDIPAWLLRQTRRNGLKLRITAIDSDARIVEHARRKFVQVNALDPVLGDAFALETHAPFDYVFANHFLHHLDDQQIVELLRRVESRARRGYVFSDLRRSRLSYWAFDLVSRVLYRDSFAHSDGKLSILKGFSVQELDALAGLAKLKHPQVGAQFPGRVYLTGGCW
jgi:2-polyprenyl-3-methyl-5-hydroxy-6-metoxy-1,4-benzoquinol methylase